jgi:thiamine-phosphate pyrophosphorylase
MALGSADSTLSNAVGGLWQPRLIAISDAARFGIQATVAAAAYVCARARSKSVVIQLREAELCEQTLFSLGWALLTICSTHDQALCVNDRLDVALALGTPRVHRKQTSEPLPHMRATLDARFGASWLTQGWHPADEAPPGGVDALLVSPVVAGRKGREPLSADMLSLALQTVSPVPVFALGGVTAHEAPELLKLPLGGIAVQAAWYREPDALLGALGLIR